MLVWPLEWAARVHVVGQPTQWHLLNPFIKQTIRDIFLVFSYFAPYLPDFELEFTSIIHRSADLCLLVFEPTISFYVRWWTTLSVCFTQLPCEALCYFCFEKCSINNDNYHPDNLTGGNTDSNYSLSSHSNIPVPCKNEHVLKITTFFFSFGNSFYELHQPWWKMHHGSQ